MNSNQSKITENKDAQKRASLVQLAVFDVDGIMTDGSLFLGDDGQEYKAFHSLDGHGLKMLKNAGVELAIITGRSSQVVLRRAEDLGITYVFQGAEEKGQVFKKLLEDLKLSSEETSYMGDDVVDLPVLTKCGFAVCVPNSPEIVKEHCHYITEHGGGRGAVREFCDFVLRAQNKYQALIDRYLI